MESVKIMPCLDMKDGRVVKGGASGAAGVVGFSLPHFSHLRGEEVFAESWTDNGIKRFKR